ncbi:MAG: YpdA family putative bacillithiol disulfide reductase [Gemmatimonadetes bacterium]|nr:YpdA family putative bacillithiol disulfide reductase [Gemmatimonadota bacterium]
MSAGVDLAIVGAGPCGLAAAVAAKRHGLSAIVFDRGSVVSSIEQYPTYITFFSTAEKISIGDFPFPVAGEKPTRREAMAYYRGVVAQAGLTVRTFEKVERIERTTTGFAVHTRTAEAAHVTAARAVVIATGYFATPRALGVPGESLPHVTHYFREGHEAFQRDALVVGGGNSAVETALDLVGVGARVTVVHLGPTFDRTIKPWVRPAFEGYVADGRIRMRWDTRVTAIRPAWAEVTGPGGTETVRADHVYLMTGFSPSSELTGPLGVRFDPETNVPEHDPATMESNVPGVHVAGVLVSGNDANRIFIENGRDHGELIAAHLARTSTTR